MPAVPVKGPAVWTVTMTVTGPVVPAAMPVGLNAQVVPAGKPEEQANVMLPVKVLPPTAVTTILVVVDCPGFGAAIGVDAGPRVKSRLTAKVTLWVFVIVPSVPWILKVKVPAVVLPAVTVNATPAAVGVIEEGDTVQVVGTSIPAQLRVTALL